MSKSKSVYVRVFRDLELLRYVLRCAIKRQLQFLAGLNKVSCYCYYIFALSQPAFPFLVLSTHRGKNDFSLPRETV